VITLGEFRDAREAYAYVPARLTVCEQGIPDVDCALVKLTMSVPRNWQHGGPAVRRSYSSVELDQFHHGLLNANRASALMHGLVSVAFWGYASGKDRIVRPSRARARARWIANGKAGKSPQDQGQVIGSLLRLKDLLQAKRFGDALLEVMTIEHLGMSFGSKVIAFMSAGAASVYDKVISEWLGRQKDPVLEGLYISTAFQQSDAGKGRQANTYAKWCVWCTAKAQELNEAGWGWADWDGLTHRWRAVDVERALFHIASRDR